MYLMLIYYQKAILDNSDPVFVSYLFIYLL